MGAGGWQGEYYHTIMEIFMWFSKNKSQNIGIIYELLQLCGSNVERCASTELSKWVTYLLLLLQICPSLYMQSFGDCILIHLWLFCVVLGKVWSNKKINQANKKLLSESFVSPWSPVWKPKRTIEPYEMRRLLSLCSGCHYITFGLSCFTDLAGAVMQLWAISTSSAIQSSFSTPLLTNLWVN